MSERKWRRVRIKLRRADGKLYMNRWGAEKIRGPGLFVHSIPAADPGLDLHDHPWWFGSLILRGGYTEIVADARNAARLAHEESMMSSTIYTTASMLSPHMRVGDRILVKEGPMWVLRIHGKFTCDLTPFEVRVWKRWSWHTMRLDQAHRIVDVEPGTLTLCPHGPQRRSKWGFFLPTPGGWLDEHAYDEKVRSTRRDLWDENPGIPSG